MRPRLAPLSLALTALALAGPPAWAEVTKTLRLDLTPAETAHFALDNLAGTVRVTAADTDRASLVATVHAESEALADTLRFERRTGPHGETVAFLTWPVREQRAFRYPGAHGSSQLRYVPGELRTDDHWSWGGSRIEVSDRHGVLLYADIEVKLPRSRIEAAFFNRVGPLSGRGLAGTLRFDTASGDVSLDDVSGEVTADTGSGNVTANGVSGGDLRCDTGSGNCEINGFKGKDLQCDTGSGNVSISGVSARRLSLDTGSGEVTVRDADVEELDADTGSGDVELLNPGQRLRRVKADTGSGDVRLRLDKAASFEARADLGSGRVVSRFPDAVAIVEDREVVGYRRGDEKIRIDVDTGSGDLVIEPASESR